MEIYAAKMSAVFYVLLSINGFFQVPSGINLELGQSITAWV
jgi:hypothetical protein